MRKYLFLLICAVAYPVAAQDDPLPVYDVVAETEITVTATGTRSEVEDTGQAVTVIGRDEIESVQGPDLTRVLERAPGVAITRNGGLGAFTGVRVRGAEAEQLLVLIDGVRVADPASPAGGYDFGNLLAGNLDKIDLLRGSNSTIWGSDAVGGVLIASTRDDTGLSVSGEYGARDTVYAAAHGGVATNDIYLGLSGGYVTTDGFSAADAGTEADGFEQYALAARGSLYLSDRLSLFARGRYAEGSLEIDGLADEFPFGLIDTDEFQETTQYSGAAGVRYDTGPLFLIGSYSFADTARDNFNPAFGTGPGFASEGQSDRVELRGEWRPIGPLIVNFGAEGERTAFETSFAARRDTHIIGAYTQAGIEFGPLSGHVGIRHDDHADFGGATSFGADVSYEIARDIRLRASVGEGFKAPSLFQLLSDFGNDALQPETSTSYDLGIAWNDRSQPFYAAATAFRRDSENQIEFVSCFAIETEICDDRPFGTYDNVGRVRAEGVELEFGSNPSDRFGMRAAYAYMDAENRSEGEANAGNDLARRPNHALTLSAEWITPLADLALGGDIRMVSDSFDDPGNFTRLDGYQVVTLRASLPVADTFELFGRVENLFDHDYQTAAGFGTPGRGAFAGARARF